MELHTDGRPILRFSLFQAWWQNKQSAMGRYFVDDSPKMSTKWMDAGSMIARELEKRPIPEWLSDIPPADISEYRIIEDFEGVLIRGTLDKFMSDKNTVVDNKSLKRKMTPKEEQLIKEKLHYTLEDFSSLKNKFDKKDACKYKAQLLFYQVLVEKRYGAVDPVAHIEVIPMLEDSNGIIRRTGETAYMVPVLTTQQERDGMRDKIVSTAADILTCWEAYQKGYITL